MNDELTASDIAKIEAEIEERKLVLRPKLLEALKEARAQGDLSENFEYYAAKREKNRNESRIRYLEHMVRTAVVISDESKEDEVGLNNTVTVWFEEEKTTEVYRIVTTVREDALNGLISKESPLGASLIGHKEGERICVQVRPDYAYHVVIKKIEKTDDDSQDRIRGF